MKLFTLILLIPAIINIETPSGYKRTPTSEFGKYLRNIALKAGNTVYLYNGQKKRNQEAQYAVIDVSVGNQDLQQCADAVMRLRAEWLFKTKQFDKIVFNSVDGNPIKFNKPWDYGHLLKHMDVVFNVCNSWSLDRDMKPRKIQDVQIGDVLIKGGFPGHVVIVVDVAINNKGEKAFMLAQSYMPAQDIHILKGQDGPWYFAKEGDINTPEYRFNSTQLKTW
jgi:hypothetical protein